VERKNLGRGPFGLGKALANTLCSRLESFRRKILPGRKAGCGPSTGRFARGQ